MDYRQFMKILKEDDNSNREVINTLQDFANEFPYFQTVHVLLSKAMHEQQHVRYEKQLKKATVYVSDRKSLYNIIHPKTKKAIPDLKLTEETTVIEKTQHANETETISNYVEKIHQQNEETTSTPHFAPPTPNESSSKYFSENNYEFFNSTETPIEKQVYADPHDIIRNRLNEILGLKDTDDIITETNKKQEIKTNEAPELKVHEKFSEKEKNQKTIIIPEETIQEKEKESEAFSAVEFSEDIGISERIDPETEEEETNLISENYSEEPDAVEMGTYDVAVEASIIQSLEKLPVLKRDETVNILPTQDEQNKENTFLDWLKTTSVSGYGRVEVVYAEDILGTEKAEEKALIGNELILVKTDIKPDAVIELINRFIKTEPKIIPSKTDFYSPISQAKKSITDNEEIVSETLARIYLEQGNLEKALSTFQKLSLIYPEKMAYFAALISEIEKTNNNLNKKEL